MRGESMKDKSKKSTYSTTFGIDPRKLTYPLRKRGDRLKAEERERLEKFFENNPAIKLAYEFKERLCELLPKIAGF